MVGADEEMSVTVVRWKIGEEPEGKPEGEPQGKEGIDADVKRELKKETRPDFLALMLERVIDTILLEEVAGTGYEDEPLQRCVGRGDPGLCGRSPGGQSGHYPLD